MGLTRPRAYQIFDIDYKQSVRVITLSNITLSGGAPTVVDSVTLSAGDRVLVAGQSTGSQNGLYQVSVLGTGSDGTWIRSVDGNETGEIDAGMIVMVTEGTTYKDTQWKLTTNDPITIGVTALVFEQNSAFAFGNIYANGTAVLADIVGDTVTFTPADNLIITANATSDTVTFAVSQSPSFTGTLGVTGNATVGNISTAGQVTATGSVTGGNLITAGLGSFGTTVSATGNITGGNLISNARIDGSNLYLSSLTANRVVFANTNGQLINSENFTFDGVTANIQGVLIVDNVEIDSNSVSSTTGNLLLETPAGSFVSVAGNLLIGGLITGNLLPSANITYNLGSPTQRWSEIFLAGNTIDIGGATISADLETGSLVLRGPTGAEFILTGSSPTDSFGIFGLIEAGNTEPSISTTTGALTVAGGAGIGGNLHVGEIFKATGNVEGGNLVTSGQVTATGNVVGGNITTAGQIAATGNITGGNIITVGSIQSATLSTSGNAIIGGDLTVNGNTIYVNITDLNVQDPIISLGRGENNAPLTSNDGKDRGEQLWYYTASEKSAFVGYDNSAGKLIAATDVTVANEIVAVNSYGNLVMGGLEAATGSFTGNVDTGNVSATTGAFTNVAGTLTTAAQPNITSVGTLTSVSVTGNITGGNISTAGMISVFGNANVGNLGATTIVATTLIGTLSTAAQPNITSVGTLTSLAVTGNVTGGNLTTGSQIIATGNVTGGNFTTTGQVVATGNIHGALIKASSNVEIQNRGILFLNDSDNSNYIGLRSPSTLTGNFTYIFPTGYGNASQVLTTNGAGGLTWEDQSGGGGGSSATSFPNSTVSPVPGSTGNFDLTFNFVQTSQEIPFESGATDPFGVNLGEVYSMMDPGGEILDPVDLGVLT